MVKWQSGSHYANFDAMIHALNVQRDFSRGRTHIILRSLVHTSGPRVPKNYRDRVQVARCTVYRLEDILDDLALYHYAGGLSAKAQVRESIGTMLASVLQELPNGEPDPKARHERSKEIPVINLTTGSGIHVGVHTITVSENYVRSLKYDPDWRKAVNGDHGDPPGPYPLSSGAPDAEHIF